MPSDIVPLQPRLPMEKSPNPLITWLDNLLEDNARSSQTSSTRPPVTSEGHAKSTREQKIGTAEVGLSEDIEARIDCSELMPEDGSPAGKWKWW